MAFSIDDLKEHNSELLNLLTQHLPDMLWVKDLDGKYLYANQSICDNLLMADDTNEPIGKGDVFFALREREKHKDKPQWHTFGELCFNSDQVVIDNNKAMKFEEYGNVKGKLMYLEVYKAPFYDKDGNIIGTVGAGRDITELKKIQLELKSSLENLAKEKENSQYQANYDALTGLPNRTLLFDRIEQSIKRSKRFNTKSALIFLDLDNFKEINDSLGHQIGDELLVQFSKRISSRMRKYDTLAHIGSDEFCIVFNDIPHISNVSDFIIDCMEINHEPYIIDEHNLYMNMSIGVSIYPNDANDSHTLFKHADTAMHKAKEDGKNTYCFYDEHMTQKAYKRVTLENKLRIAIKEDEFIVYYQPQIDIENNSVIGVEALVRWQPKDSNMIPPNLFIPLAEESGLIVPLDRLIMQKAIKDFCDLKTKGLDPQKLSLNLSIKQLEESDFIDFIKSVIKENENVLNFLELEVTETQIMKNSQNSINILNELQNLGIKISIDDFGTGYSSLAYLKKLPIYKLKIDKSFIDGIIIDNDDTVLTKTIIDLSKNLNLDVIAEGVETEEQKEFLRNNGCTKVQGYFYSKPLSKEDLAIFLSNNKLQ
jgi:diguanylate cyclase (GGDEF)-like protein